MQSGSDRVLERMRRDYTVAAYLERLAALRQARPGIAVTTDIIVGFPGETEEDFQRTLALTQSVRFDNQFSFIFSARPRTAAGLREKEWGAIPREIKVERLERLQQVQRQISAEIMAEQVGEVREVLVEGSSKFNPAKRFGRTAENRSVNFEGDAPAGVLAKVAIGGSSPNALAGVEVARV